MTQDKNSPELFYPGITDKAKQLHPEIFQIMDEVRNIIKKKDTYESQSKAIPEELDVKLAEYVAYLEAEELTVFSPAIAELSEKLKEVDEKSEQEEYKNSIMILETIVYEIKKVQKEAHDSYPHVKKES